ncbi:MAG: DUF4097 family beta strand repeat-containing protein [Desulfobacteraceae bacterium]|jgi:hypothetical protein
MKKAFIIKIVLIILLFGSNICFSGEKRYNRELEFGDSNAKKVLQINGNGNIDISGYKGDKVLISADVNIFEENDEVTEKTKGLKKISSAGFNIINNKKENSIIIFRPFDGIDLNIKVPNNVTLKLGNGPVMQNQVYINRNEELKKIKKQTKEIRKQIREQNRQMVKNMQNGFHIPQIPDIPVIYSFGQASGIINGDVYIKNFSGTIEVNTVNGSINAENIKGEANVSTVSGNINVSFKALNKDSALYFSTVSGEIDITLPKDIKADILAKTMKGDVYSGFDGDIIPGNDMEDKTDESASQKFFMTAYYSNYITTRINGGGDSSVYLNTMNSNIYIRKGE